MRYPLMPTGVEHYWRLAQFSGPWIMRYPLMPTGVEHLQNVLKQGIEWLCVTL